MIKLIVAGSREFNNYKVLLQKLDFYLSKTEEVIEIVSGGARGADFLGEQYAKEKGYPIKLFPADWDKYGKSAGFLRNKQMAEYSTHCVCFWDGKSKGTKHMIDLAIANKLILRIVRY